MLFSRRPLTALLFSFLVVSIFLYFQISPSKRVHLKPSMKKAFNLAATEINAQLSETYGKLPIRFEANLGQTDERVKFLARDRGYSLFLTPQSAVMVLPVEPAKPATGSVEKVSLESPETQRAVVSMSLLNANPSPKMLGEDELVTKSNYFIGSDPAKWRTEITNFGRVRYQEAYPGIDMIYYGNPQQLEYDFEVSPGVDPDTIKINFEGQDAIEIDDAGNLILQVKSGRILQNAPVVYQQYAGERISVPGKYVLLGDNLVGFDVGEYDPEKVLVIDPSISFATYLGGAGFDQGSAIALEPSGTSPRAYVFGYTFSSDFPFIGGFIDSNLGGSSDAFVSKINSAGSALIYSTYLGGSSTETAGGIAIDSSGNAYVTGKTLSSDFPFAGSSIDSTLGGSSDAFVSKINSAGSALIYSTYLGGSTDEALFGSGIAVDSSGNAYVVGDTSSSDFPFIGGFIDSNLGGTRDAFVSKLNSAGSALIYSSYLGGGQNETGRGVAVDSSGNAYIVGNTASSDFPFVGGVDSSLDGSDAFVSKVNAAGSALTYSTYLGGTLSETARGIALDSSGNAYIVGDTGSSDFPTVGGVDSNLGGLSDAFVTKINASGSALTFSTYLGGLASDFGHAIAVDSSLNTYVTGLTQSADFPTTLNAIDFTRGPAPDQEAFISKLNAAGSKLTFSTYLGGAENDSGNGIALDFWGNAYITGYTKSSDFPKTAGVLDSVVGGFDGFVVKYLFDSDSIPPFEVVSPYWQAQDTLYTFISVAHPSLAGMSTEIGVVMTALNTDGSLRGSLEFSILSGDLQRVFITATNFVFGPDSNPNDRFLILNSGAVGAGNLGFSSLSNPLVKRGNGFPDIRALTFWGAVVILHSSTGFAMEFIGDMQDSRAFSSANFSGLN